MDKKNELLMKLENEHEELQFLNFNNKKALRIGLRLQEISENKQLSITIDITLNRQQLFHYACAKTSADNDQWIKRKNNVVYHFNKSSFYIKNLLENDKMTIDQKFFLSSEEYSPFGGAFPIILKDTGAVGTITVSGLPDKEDHELVTSVIREFI